MRMRDAGRLISIFAATSLVMVVAASCGGAGGAGPGSSDASTYDGPGTFILQDSSTVVTNSCVPKTCAQQGYDCGPNGDGCGDPLMDCGSCPAGQMCGGSRQTDW